MGKASSEEAVTDAVLTEAEEIGKNLESQKPTVSHDAPDIFFLHKLIDAQPDLVPREPYDYYVYYELYLQKEEGYTSTRAIAQTVGLKSHGSLKKPFDTIKAAIADMREAESIGPVKIVPALDSTRLYEIQSKGKLVQLDPYALLPPEGHKDYDFSRYFQKRRGPRLHSIEVLAESIGKSGMYENPTVQDNVLGRRLADGFSRIMGWLLADKNAGGTSKNPILEFPVCLLVDCTDAEGDLIALEKNKNKDNYDIGDRDYSIVIMHERYPAIYTQKVLAELNNLSPSTVSGLISAWRDSWPCDSKKNETKQNNPIRKALENRQITTYHGRALAKLQKWPTEQKRIADWLLLQVEMMRRRDAYAADYWTNSNEPDSSGELITKFDTHGISAGKLMQMVRSVEDTQKDIADVAKAITQMLKNGTIEKKVHEEDLYVLQKKVSSSITKDAFKQGLRAAGVSITTVKPKAADVRPKSPATKTADASSQTRVLSASDVIHEPESKPIKVCWHCPIALRPSLREGEITCQIGLAPNEDNECPVQFMLPGDPSRHRMQCVHCGGYTFPEFLESFDVETELDSTKGGNYFMAHTLCMHDIKVKELDIKGECHSCCRESCDLLDAVENGKLDVEVKHCPEEEWFTPRPEKSIKQINKEVKEQIDHFVKQAREDFEKSKATTVVTAGRSD